MIFYNKTSKIYYNYTNNNYLLLNEDNMIHHISTFITNYKDYRNIIDLSFKNLTKQSILRCIKIIRFMIQYQMKIQYKKY